MQFLTTTLSALLMFGSQALAYPTQDQTPKDAPLLKRGGNIYCYNTGWGDSCVHCYDSGWKESRTTLTGAIDDFCDEIWKKGKLTDNDDVYKQIGNIVLSVESKGCSAIDKDLQCKKILRKPVDQCNMESTSDKQGGTVETDCAVWRVDPNEE